MEMNEGKHETHIQGDVYGLVQGDQPQVTMHFHQAAPHQPLSPRDSLNRQHLLAKVCAFWIRGVLEQSLHGAALIALGLEERRDVLADPWRLVLQQEGQAARSLPEGTRITQAFDEAVEELLILGEPGAGKTTLLLELARDLLERAEKDENHPIPVVFNLSEWEAKRQPLTKWIVEELNSKYQVPRKVGKEWVDADQLLPLLDGLDEVSGKVRGECIEAINTYRQEHGLVPLVVCSRSAEYLAQKTRVLLRGAVMVQSLTTEQIDAYLSYAGEQLEAVRVALHDDPLMQELATTPLMLSVLSLAYQGRHVENRTASDSLESRRRQIVATYIERMLQRRGARRHYSPQRIMHWLGWLAQQMLQHHQMEFFIERMQPDWLPDLRSRRGYHVSVGLLVGMILGLIVGSTIWFALGGLRWLGPHALLLSVLIVGLLSGLRAGRRPAIHPAEVVVWSWVRVKENMPSWLLYFLQGGWALGFLTGLGVGLFGGDIGNGILLGVGFWLPLGFLSGLFSGMLFGFSREMVDHHTFVKPNQGIWRSARNGLLFGISVGLAFWLVLGLVLSLVYWLILGLVVGIERFPEFLSNLYFIVLYGRSGELALWLVVFYLLLGVLELGLYTAPAFGLAFGGLAFIQHFVLRFLLWRAACMPWNYSRFLDYATERILLHKVGGSYIFVHRLLLDYFASLETSYTQKVSAVSVSPQKPDEEE